MTEIIMGFIILTLIGTNIYLIYRMIGMNEKYMKAFMAKNLTDFTQNEIIEKSDPIPQTGPEFIPIEETDEDTFKKVLKNIDNGQQFNSEV